jgi:hypothetical protein
VAFWPSQARTSLMIAYKNCYKKALYFELSNVSHQTNVHILSSLAGVS